MELEQAKLEELEGDDSRVVDEEDFGENEDGNIDPVRRRGGYPFEESKDGTTADDIGRVNQNNSSNLSGQGMRMNLGGPNGNGKPSNGSLDGMNSFQDQGTWNADDQRYTSILVGHQSARRRFDMDKQAVLCQISELDFNDLFPIVLSCQFSLCVFYARAIFVRLIRQISSPLETSSISPLTAADGTDSGEVNGMISEMLLKVLLQSQAGQDPHVLIHLMSVCFRQGQGPASQPERLFPSLLQVSSLSPPLISLSVLFPSSLLFFTHLLHRELQQGILSIPHQPSFPSLITRP
jgi:hypothetical protein